VGRFFVAGFFHCGLLLEGPPLQCLFSRLRQGLPKPAEHPRRKTGFVIYTTEWYVFLEGIPMSFRLFKTKGFAIQASKAWITDDELREAFAEMLDGQADNLGGGVWKKRLKENRYRSIVLAKGGRYWIYQVLFAKKDRSNINSAELKELRKLAKAYAQLTEEQIQGLLVMKAFVEITHE
jgi:hypothetical protein